MLLRLCDVLYVYSFGVFERSGAYFACRYKASAEVHGRSARDRTHHLVLLLLEATLLVES